MIAAVTPVPQLLMMGLLGSTPFSWNILRSSSAGNKALDLESSKSENGTLIEPGMCPEGRPAQTSLPLEVTDGSEW